MKTWGWCLLIVLVILAWVIGYYCWNCCKKEAKTSTTVVSNENLQETVDKIADEIVVKWAEPTDYYITELNENVERESVLYKNRYGMYIAWDLYTPKGMDKSQKYPALIVWAPYGWVKEQWPAVYANELAQRGFVVLTFDQSFMGESEWEPRHVSSPDIFVENFSAWVDFLWLQDFVDRDRIWVIGICGSAWFAISAAQVDTRIKAIATTSMYDISSARINMGITWEALENLKNTLSKQRWVDAENWYPNYNPSFPIEAYEDEEHLPETDALTNEWNRFYAVPRWHHPNARWGFTDTSMLSFMNFDLLNYIKEVSPRPILFIAWDIAHSRAFSETAYEAAWDAKELYIVEWAEHIDLYDDVTKIPFDKLESFFNENL